MAALLCWLDARSRGAQLLLRLEDLDSTRLRAGQREEMRAALAWLGLDWDACQLQSELAEQHQEALDTLAGQGLLYPCSCSRRELRQRCQAAPGGGVAYDNRCRARELPAAGWREIGEPLRVRLPNHSVQLIDESGLNLSQLPILEMGDPLVRRRDGSLAYQLAVVVDDAASEVNRIVRGRDLATSTATQYLLQELLGAPHPCYRHHFLLLEEQGTKLAKLHGSIPFQDIAAQYEAPEFCGLLAKLSGLQESAQPCTPQALLPDFTWDNVRDEDLVY